MSLLRVFCPLAGAPQRCEWVLLEPGHARVPGEGPLAQLPKTAGRTELVIAASQVRITRVHLPGSGGRRAASLLAYAVEDTTACEADAIHVTRLGAAGGADVLAVLEREGLDHWRKALAAVGLHRVEVVCETLMLPLAAGGWSFLWNGREGFVRTGAIEGAATDCGALDAPPLSLRLMLDEAKARNELPSAIALYVMPSEAAPDAAAWERSLGIRVLPAQPWSWRAAPADAGVAVVREARSWRPNGATLARLRPIAWVAGLALSFHAVALAADWARLAAEQRALRAQMESHFRSAFPDAVAVADPGLQMRRQLAAARHAASQADEGDFLVMSAKLAAGLNGLPAGAVRVVSYESGRLTLELAITEEALLRRVAARLLQAGLTLEAAPVASGSRRDTVILTVRTS